MLRFYASLASGIIEFFETFMPKTFYHYLSV